MSSVAYVKVSNFKKESGRGGCSVHSTRDAWQPNLQPPRAPLRDTLWHGWYTVELQLEMAQSYI